MSDKESNTQLEINEYIADLDNWINQISSRDITESRAGVVNRFKRDCEQLKTDLIAVTAPFTADLVDYTDRCNSLNIQFNNIISGL